MTENKRIRTCHKYHYDTVKICRETDVIFTRCRVCKQLYPSTLEYFRKDKSEEAQRLIQPLCKKCWREKDAIKREQQKLRELQIEVEDQPTNFEERSLFDWKIFTKESEEEETVESKVDRILAFLWLTKWTCKK
jgi:hypothetical protein